MVIRPPFCADHRTRLSGS